MRRETCRAMGICVAGLAFAAAGGACGVRASPRGAETDAGDALALDASALDADEKGDAVPGERSDAAAAADGSRSQGETMDSRPFVAAVASISGAMWENASECSPTGPVSVLEIHATMDPVISYDGGLFDGTEYPSAMTTVGDWAELDRCSAAATVGAPAVLSGSSASTESFGACEVGVAVGLWSVDVAAHLPLSGASATSQVLAWLFAHPKT